MNLKINAEFDNDECMLVSKVKLGNYCQIGQICIQFNGTLCDLPITMNLNKMRNKNLHHLLSESLTEFSFLHFTDDVFAKVVPFKNLSDPLLSNVKNMWQSK